MTARGILRGGMVLGAGNVAATASSFIRNLIVARLLSVEDFGIASLFAMGMAFLQAVSNVAVDRILVQSREGGSAQMQDTAHAFQVMRGFAMAGAMYAVAGLVARVFGVPEVAWAFEVLAVVPAISGFAHLDPVRVQRDMKFLPLVGCELASQMVTMLVAWPICSWLGDYRAMVWMLVIQAAIQVAASHWVAVRRYAWRWDGTIVRSMVSFGWPLMVNGVLVFLILNGDKAVVGSFFSVRELGWYGAAFMLTLAPWLLVSKVLQTLLMPILSRAQDQAELFRDRYLLAQEACIVTGTVLTIGLVVCGEGLLLLLFGQKYAEGVGVILWLGLTQGLRTWKLGPMTGAVALGKTKNPMFANVARVASLGLAIVAVQHGAGVIGVAVAGLVGEMLSLLLSMYLMARSADLPLFVIGRTYLRAALFIVLAFWLWRAVVPDVGPVVEVLLGGGYALVAGLILLSARPAMASRLSTAFVRRRAGTASLSP